MDLSKYHKLLSSFFDKGFFRLLSANFLIQVVAFASQLFVANLLIPDNLGRIKIIQTYFSVFAIIAGMGLNVSTLKLCSENRSNKQKQHFFTSAIVFTLIASIIVYILIITLSYFNIFSTDSELKNLFPIGMFPLISSTLLTLFVSYFQAVKQIKRMSNITISNKLISIFSIVLFTWAWGIQGYYIAFNMSFILLIIACYLILKPELNFNISISALKYSFSHHKKYAQHAIFANFLTEIAVYIDLFLISYFVSDMYSIGQYSLALTLTVALKVIPSTVQQIASPYFSANQNNKVVFLNTFKQYNKLLIVIVIVTLIVALSLSKWGIHFIYDNKYNDAIPLFQLLAIGWSFRQLIQLQAAAMFGLGKINYNALVSLFSLLSNLPMYYIALKLYGLQGLAFATIISGVWVVILSNYYFRKALKTWQVHTIIENDNDITERNTHSKR